MWCQTYCHVHRQKHLEQERCSPAEASTRTTSGAALPVCSHSSWGHVAMRPITCRLSSAGCTRWRWIAPRRSPEAKHRHLVLLMLTAHSASLSWSTLDLPGMHCLCRLGAHCKELEWQRQLANPRAWLHRSNRRLSLSIITASAPGLFEPAKECLWVVSAVRQRRAKFASSAPAQGPHTQ